MRTIIPALGCVQSTPGQVEGDIFLLVPYPRSDTYALRFIKKVGEDIAIEE